MVADAVVSMSSSRPLLVHRKPDPKLPLATCGQLMDIQHKYQDRGGYASASELHEESLTRRVTTGKSEYKHLIELWFATEALGDKEALKIIRPDCECIAKAD